MLVIVLVIHVLIAIALIGVVLMQKSEGGALGIGGGGMGGIMSGRGAANLLTRSTAILAAAFFVTSIALAVLTSERGEPESILTQPVQEQPQQPSGPSVPLSD